MAYWTGFLFADGNVHEQREGKYTIRLKLKCIDFEHVQKYKTALESTYALNVYKNLDWCIAAHAICCTEMAEDLIQLGCVPNKSLILEWPNRLPDEFVSHFVRGYFDGDGCVGCQKRDKSVTLQFAGSHSFITSLSSYVKSNVLNSVKANGCRSKQGNISTLVFCGNKSAMKVLDWMYQKSNESIRLDRKYAMYKKFREISTLETNDKIQAMAEFKSSDEWKALNECKQKKICPQLHVTKKKCKSYTVLSNDNHTN